jgi:hypothetical protein
VEDAYDLLASRVIGNQLRLLYAVFRTYLTHKIVPRLHDLVLEHAQIVPKFIVDHLHRPDMLEHGDLAIGELQCEIGVFRLPLIVCLN